MSKRGAMSGSRRQRRAYEAFLKKMDPQGYKEYKEGSIQRGIELHQQHEDRVKLQNQKSADIIDFDNL